MADKNVAKDYFKSFLSDEVKTLLDFQTLFEEGLEKGKAEFVTNLIRNTDFDNNKIAELANVSVEFVNNIHAELNK